MGTARAEDPGRSEAKEAAEAVPTESVRSKWKSEVYLDFCSKRTVRFYPVLNRKDNILGSINQVIPIPKVS